jgi:hypothetical protein
VPLAHLGLFSALSSLAGSVGTQPPLPRIELGLQVPQEDLRAEATRCFLGPRQRHGINRKRRFGEGAAGGRALTARPGGCSGTSCSRAALIAGRCVWYLQYAEAELLHTLLLSLSGRVRDVTVSAPSVRLLRLVTL